MVLTQENALKRFRKLIYKTQNWYCRPYLFQQNVFNALNEHGQTIETMHFSHIFRKTTHFCLIFIYNYSLQVTKKLIATPNKTIKITNTQILHLSSTWRVTTYDTIPTNTKLVVSDDCCNVVTIWDQYFWWSVRRFCKCTRFVCKRFILQQQIYFVLFNFFSKLLSFWDVMSSWGKCTCNNNIPYGTGIKIAYSGCGGNNSKLGINLWTRELTRVF